MIKITGTKVYRMTAKMNENDGKIYEMVRKDAHNSRLGKLDSEVCSYIWNWMTDNMDSKVPYDTVVNHSYRTYMAGDTAFLQVSYTLSSDELVDLI